MSDTPRGHDRENVQTPIVPVSNAERVAQSIKSVWRHSNAGRATESIRKDINSDG